MFCPSCGAPAPDAAKFCTECGLPLPILAPAAPTLQPHVSAPRVHAPEPGIAHPAALNGGFHPWRRYVAKWVDIMWLGISLMVASYVAIVILSPSSEPGLARAVQNQFFAGVWLMLCWMVIETILLATVGTTPARAIFGIRVIPISGEHLTFIQALQRTTLVAVMGLGMGLPLISLFTLIAGYNRLKKTNSTRWDDAVGTQVAYTTWGPWRVLASWVTALITLLAMVVLIGAGK